MTDKTPIGTVQVDSPRRMFEAIRAVRKGIATEGTTLTVDQCIALAAYFDANRRYLCAEEDVERLLEAVADLCELSIHRPGHPKMGNALLLGGFEFRTNATTKEAAVDEWLRARGVRRLSTGQNANA